MLGCSPRFNVSGRPQQTVLCERLIGTLKSMTSKVAADHPKSWYKHLGFILWALREVPNETRVPPWLMVFGKLPRWPLAVLKESWCGQRDVPLSLGQTTTEYLKELKENLKIANSYAETHTQREQQRYISRNNLRTREKSFTIGEKVLLLVPDSTSSKTFSRWRGPGTVVERKSPHSYIVSLMVVGVICTQTDYENIICKLTRLSVTHTHVWMYQTSVMSMCLCNIRTLFTDHDPSDLSHWNCAQECQIMQWALALQEYDEKLRRSLALQQSRKSIARPKRSITQASSSEQQHCSSVSLIQRQHRSDGDAKPKYR